MIRTILIILILAFPVYADFYVTLEQVQVDKATQTVTETYNVTGKGIYAGDGFHIDTPLRIKEVYGVPMFRYTVAWGDTGGKGFLLYVAFPFWGDTDQFTIDLVGAYE